MNNLIGWELTNDMYDLNFVLGLGQGILLPATYLATYSYFKKRLTLAVSISTTGASLLAIAMPKICDILLAHTERRYTVLILFAISLLSLLGCFLMKQPGKIYDGCEKRQDHELKESPVSKDTDELEETGHKLIPSTIYNETTTPTKTNTICQRVCNTFNLELLEQRTYVLIVVGLGISFAAELNVILTMQFILPELSKFTRTQVANVSSILSIFDIIGRMLIPLLSYHFEVPRRLVYIIALILATSARTMLASFGESHVVVYVACSLIGLTKGTRAVFQSVIIPEVVPLENIPAANGINMLFNGAVSLVVGPIIGENFIMYILEKRKFNLAN
ncbi:hypothetical protein JTB14_024431 [Gonioctena quinquepunctata]|nr:hypothetical protein JTB14_024431 [Gonioctena quinquepunctata]